MAERAIAEVGGNYGHQPNFKKHLDQAKTPSSHIIQMAKSGAKSDKQIRRYKEETNPIDTVTVDVPLLLRIMEYAKEDAKTDMDLHNVAEKMIELSSSGDTLNMDNYKDIVDNMSNESLRTENPCWKGYKPVGTKKKNGKTVPNCVPKNK